MTPALLAEGLRKTWRRSAKTDRPALDGLDLVVRPGEIVGLLGPNGAGKTTAIGVMTGLARPDQGRVSVFGHDYGRSGAPARTRRRVGLVPQDIALYPELTLLENLRYFGSLYGMDRRELSQGLERVLEIAGLADRSDARVETFSGGMKRRANLAAGLIHGPDLLFLDEPTVGVDAQSRHLILQRLAELAAAGMAMLYTTHYMEEAASLCHRVVVMDLGRSVADGRAGDLLAAHPGCADLGELYLDLTGRSLRD